MEKNKEEHNHDKCHDDFDLRKCEYSGGRQKDFINRCRKSFFESIGLDVDEEDEKDDEDI